MSISKRVGALLCALALILHLVFVPLRARAFAGVLPAVAAGTVVTAFLMASGIYPYEEQKEFAEYVSSNLSSLWSQYLDWRTENSMNPPVTGNELSSLTGYLTQGVVAISRNVWGVLSEFTSWIVSHFSVTDNQTGAQLGIASNGGVLVPYISGSFGSGNYYNEIVSSGGLYIGNDGNSHPVYILGMHDFSSLYLFYVRYSATVVHAWLFSLLDYSGKAISAQYHRGDKTSYYIYTNPNYDFITLDGITYQVYGVKDGVFSITSDSVPSGAIVYDSKESAVRAFLGLGPGGFSGVTADTTTVSALPALPADTPWGGLAVDGAGTAATVGAVEQVVQDGVTERQKPEVKVVEVELGANTDVDAETGEVTENPVVVTPENVVPSLAEFFVPQEFTDTMLSTIRTKFPFCIPFQIFQIIEAFVVPPSAPVISLTFHDSFSDSDYTISVDLSPWNEVAAVVRQFETIILLVTFCLNFSRFDPLQYFFGNHVGPIGFHE